MTFRSLIQQAQAISVSIHMAIALGLCSSVALGAPALSLVCRVSPGSNSPSIDSPIWLDLTVTNEGPASFNGFYETINNHGASITLVKGNTAALQPVRQPLYLDVLSAGLSLAPGQSRIFHVLLNELYTPLKPGYVKGTIAFPISTAAAERILVRSVISFDIGGPTTRDQLRAISTEIQSCLTVHAGKSLQLGAEFEPVRSIRALPDPYALPLLQLALSSSDNGVQYEALVVLADRPVTPEIIRMVKKVAASEDEEVKSIAEEILMKAKP